MGQESLSLFPSETDRDINRTAGAVVARAPIPRGDDQLAMFGAIETPPLRPALSPTRPSPPPGQARRIARTPVAIIAAIAILGMTGLVLLRPADNAPSDEPSPVAVSSPLVPVAEAAAVQSMPVQSAPSLEAPVVSTLAPPAPPPLAPTASTRAKVPAPSHVAQAAPRTREVSSRATAAKVIPRSESRTSSAAKAPAYTGTLIVDSVPQGAAVTMNQKPLGVTPLRLAAQPAGSYAIWVEHEGFERWTAGVRVTAEKTTRVRPILTSKVP